MTRTTTRFLTTLAAGFLGLALVACASQKSREETASATATQPAADAKSDAKADKKADKKGPQALGYAIMNSNGEPLYCKRMSTVGSNVVRVTKCLTAREWQAVHNNDQRTVEELRKGFDYPSNAK